MKKNNVIKVNFKNKKSKFKTGWTHDHTVLVVCIAVLVLVAFLGVRHV